MPTTWYVDSYTLVQLEINWNSWIKLYALMLTYWLAKRSGNCDLIILHIRNDMASKIIERKMTIEDFFVETTCEKRNGFLCCSYNPKSL